MAQLMRVLYLYYCSKYYSHSIYGIIKIFLLSVIDENPGISQLTEVFHTWYYYRWPLIKY